ncbi:MAG TPA: SDR family NAD(P)-dependent oxidoreductase [Nocardioidaceae bacterium]|nr:SDR family NAD(P)-dependent oxidoreductase [Nocardioidaceae bacterium]
MMDPAESRVCLVTGAGRGIGTSVARVLSERGDKVALAARSGQDLDRVAAWLPGPALVVPTDVTDPAAVEEMFAAVEAEWGPVEVLVANAGAGETARVVDTTDEQWQRMLDLNLTAPFRCLRRALPSMIAHEWGRVVVVASVAAKHGERMVSAYSASKHGVLGLVRAASLEVASHGVTVNAVCPGYVNTPMTEQTVESIAERTGRTHEQAHDLLARRQPTRRLVEPAEVADAVLACVDNASINGQGINVDGGAVQS